MLKTQTHIQEVFVVLNRDRIIKNVWKDELEIDYDERFVFKAIDYIVPDGTS